MVRTTCGFAAFVAIVLACAGAAQTQSSPGTIEAGGEWVPLQAELDIVPGSALDFTRLGLNTGPAGNHGRIIATPEGQFAFEDQPGTPRRFYGVNFCYGAQYLSHAEADRVAERIMRLGYNTVRLHHYEGVLVEGQRDTTTFNPERLDQLDYLCAAFARRGLYISTDLFTSRPVMMKEIGIDKPGLVGMDHFKILVPVHERAWDNWKKFSRALLTHVNPYTNRSYADDPALAWLSLINEGNFGNFLADLRTTPEWQKSWNVWLAKRYRDRNTLRNTWGGDLKTSEDPARNSVELPTTLNEGSPRVRDCVMFFTETDLEFTTRMKNFVRGELGCRALVTNNNSWTNHVTSQAARTLYDYVDDHYYIDHPRFLEKDWSLPSRSPNTSPVLGGAIGGRDKAFTRLFDKPFTITEYNYSGPGRFRGVGGILTGAFGALQGWAGIWRFAYSHERDAVLSPAPINFFDMANDPLGQASERASLCLFLRGDMKPAPHSAAIVMKRTDLDKPPLRIPVLSPRWHWAGWITRVGTYVGPDSRGRAAFTLPLPLGWDSTADGAAPSPYQLDDTTLVTLLKQRGILDAANSSDPSKPLLISETGEITIDGPRDTMVLDTPRTAGGYAPAGQEIRTDGVIVKLQSSDATVWVSSLDSEPIRSSRRLLVTHLTDLQNTGIRYKEEARQTLLDWGRLPHLVRAGKALVRIRTAYPERLQIWSLSTSGRRVSQVPARVVEGMLHFEASVAGDAANGARMLYEIAER